ncbi:MAG TPA: hypothetical protein VHN79_14205 [Lacunisphaera sp.]|nr:hypothetical protein [Lacunisphaera sp.]
MKTKFLSNAGSSQVNRLPGNPSLSPFAQRLTTAAAVRARYPAPTPGRLVDPFLLDRLQAPLTRFRD